MRRDKLFTFCILGISASFFALPRLFAVDIAPASVRDIADALGPDAKGLTLSQDVLPDLFALTASRIEENPKQFTVVQPYLSGRWKGGKVVIEYARDLSYTLVSVYDKDNHRQRIYSVRTTFTDHVAHQETHEAQAPAAAPAAESDWGSANTAQQNPPQEAEAPAQKSSARTRTTQNTNAPVAPPAAVEPIANTPENVGFEWDEASGSYVPVTAPVAAVPAETTKASETKEPSSTSRRHRKRRDETVVASARTTSSASAKQNSMPAPMQDSGIWLPSADKTKTPSSAAQVKAQDTSWTESEPSAPAEEKSSHKKKKKKHSDETTTSVAKTTPAPSTQDTEDWVPRSIQETPTKGKTPEVPSRRAVESEVPSTEDLLAGPSPTAQPSASSPPSTEKPSRKHRTKRSESQESVAAVPPVPAAPIAAPAAQTVQEPPAAPSSRHKESAAPPAASPKSAPVPTAEELLAKAGTPVGPDTSASDTWVPKATSKPAVVDVPAQEAAKESMKVAMVPKAAPVDNSVDNLLKMANEGKGEVPHESDSWVPKKSAAAKPEVDLNKELERVRAEEKKNAAPKPKVQVRHDVNNPEEGVLPVSSFEKFSGPMYGRHREYERRFYPGKKPKTKAPDHDFYVDEVDRKKEIHNVYFYQHQKGKAPRLIAVERHSRVSFLGNYDIEKEDKGKVSSYN